MRRGLFVFCRRWEDLGSEMGCVFEKEVDSGGDCDVWVERKSILI